MVSDDTRIRTHPAVVAVALEDSEAESVAMFTAVPAL